MKYAENPPKKYEDIVIPDFYADPALWEALRDIFLFWASEGVRIFRVDNPHTKPIPLWAWLISEVRNILSGRDLLGGGLHASRPDVSFGEDWIHRVLYLLHLAQYKSRTDDISDGAQPDRRQGIFSAAFLRQYS